MTKQLLLRTSEQFLVPFDLTKSFLCSASFERVSCLLRITEQFLAPFEVRNHSLCPGNYSELRKSVLRPPNYEIVCCIIRITQQFLVSHQSWNSFSRFSNHDWPHAVCSTDFNYVLILVGHELVLILKYWLPGTNRPPRHIHIQQTFVLTSSQISIKHIIGYTEYVICEKNSKLN
jgi:hypothetical protein